MVSEKEYADYLEVLFNEKYPTADVEREVYTDSGRFCDFLIKTDLFRFAVEVEDSSEDVVTNGVAQTLLYAEELDAIPVVVYPPDEKNNDKEIELLQSFCEIIDIPFGV